MDPKNPNRESRSTPQYALYQRENFWKSNDGQVPPFNTEPGELERLAQAKLTQNGWYYASSNAGYIIHSSPIFQRPGITNFVFQTVSYSYCEPPGLLPASYYPSHACRH